MFNSKSLPPPNRDATQPQTVTPSFSANQRFQPPSSLSTPSGSTSNNASAPQTRFNTPITARHLTNNNSNSFQSSQPPPSSQAYSGGNAPSSSGAPWPVVNKASSSAIAAAAAKAFTNLSGVDPDTIDPSVNELITENFKMALEMMPFMNPNTFAASMPNAGVAVSQFSPMPAAAAGPGLGLNKSFPGHGAKMNNFNRNKGNAFSPMINSKSNVNMNTNNNLQQQFNNNNNRNFATPSSSSALGNFNKKPNMAHKAPPVQHQQQQAHQPMYQNNARFQHNSNSNFGNQRPNGGFKTQAHRFPNNNRQTQANAAVPQAVFRYKKVTNEKEDGEVD